MVSLMTLLFICMMEWLGHFFMWLFKVWIWFIKIIGVLVLIALWIAIVLPINLVMLIAWGIISAVAHHRRESRPYMRHNRIWMVYPSKQ